MRKILTLILGLICLAAKAEFKTITDCLKIETGVAAITADILTQDFKISPKEIQWEKTEIVLLKEVKVDRPFSDYLVRQNIIEQDNNLPLDRLSKLYTDDHPRNLVVEISYFNQQNKKIVFLASSVMNDNYCSMVFNGFLIITREF